ncbi:MAG: hypothetical protein NVSMB25_19150 [Thermoleophilaceae bacterium]
MKPLFRRGVSPRAAVLLVLSGVCLLAGGAAAASPKPAAATRNATAITPTGATLNGAVNGRGQSISYHFDYGLSSRYGLSTPQGSVTASASSVAVSAPVSGLNPDTTYHFRLVATAANRTARGSDRSFHTPRIPTVSTISVTPATVIFGGVASVTGALRGPPDEGGKQVALEAEVFPYTVGFRQVGNTVLTDAQGGYSFTVAPLIATTHLRVADRSMPSVHSPTVTEQVAVKVSLRARRLRGRHRRRLSIRFSGTVTPAHPDARIAIQVWRKGTWRTLATTGARTSSAFESFFVKTMRVPGRGRYRASVAVSDGRNVGNASPSLPVH